MASTLTYAIALDLGATNFRVAIVSSDGEIVKKAIIETKGIAQDADTLISTFIESIEDIIKGIKKTNLLGIGVSVAGPVDMEKGILYHPANIDLQIVPISHALEQEFSLPVVLYNDANSAAIAEKVYGVGKVHDNFVYVTISSGIGGGVYCGGSLILGHHGSAGEVGRFVVNSPCDLGLGRSEWEDYCSGMNLPRFYQAFCTQNGRKIPGPFPQTAEGVFEESKKGLEHAVSFLEEYGRVNAQGFLSVAAAYNPEIIILGGSVVRENRELIIPYMQKYTQHRSLQVPDAIVTELGDDISLLGAAASFFMA